jgi:hypothetical protein
MLALSHRRAIMATRVRNEFMRSGYTYLLRNTCRLTTLFRRKCISLVMAKKLFVGGLAYSTDEATLRTAFEECGTVTSAAIITDRVSGRSKGFGFVEMSTDEEADAAISKWDGKDLDGRRVQVSPARPMADRDSRPRGGDHGSSWDR